MFSWKYWLAVAAFFGAMIFDMATGFAEEGPQQPMVYPGGYAVSCMSLPDFEKVFAAYTTEETWIASDGKHMWQFWNSGQERVLTMRTSTKPIICLMDSETIKGEDS